MAHVYDYGMCSESDQSGIEAQKRYAKYAPQIIDLVIAYWGDWDKIAEYFPFSAEPMCASPNPELFKKSSKCRYDMLFNDKCDWECYHENCDYDFFGNDGTSSSFYSWEAYCGRQIFNPSESKTMIQFEIANHEGKTPIPDMETVKVSICLFLCFRSVNVS